MNENDEIRRQLLEAVCGLSDDQLNEPEEKGRWSIMQTMHHLYLMERSIAIIISNRLKSKISMPAEQKPIDLTVDRSRKVGAPVFVVPTKRYLTLEKIKEKLEESRKELKKVENSANTDALEQKSFPHPVFGPMSLKQWIPFVGYHEKRHLAQIEEIKEKVLSRQLNSL
ncbi:DinB family protein [Fictibacillus terranigra]|uniref:DinB family protein n=1 Tax=Fictibacillus terranigra TaxID=3058424 RepID=A0ABT8E8Q4_9BACL|nr:DinB family protein [Fictibacillus sp. CENA-BCM004]MDN4074272.1 DinB family protein [Fictibacillus sp. CENA-BCM004]